MDQFEQDALRSRSRLISSCNNLAQNLDNLKLRIGLPPETPANQRNTDTALEEANDCWREMSAD